MTITFILNTRTDWDMLDDMTRQLRKDGYVIHIKRDGKTGLSTMTGVKRNG